MLKLEHLAHLSLEQSAHTCLKRGTEEEVERMLASCRIVLTSKAHRSLLPVSIAKNSGTEDTEH
jgi:hypothetical protein